jgi:phospholipase C
MDKFGLTNAGDHDQYFMGYYERSDLAYYYQLADTFTLCDAYHCSVLGPTTPNRLYAMTGMIDPDGLYGGPVEGTVSVTTAIEDQYGIYDAGWQTFPETLTEAGVSWKVYASPDGDDQYNPLLLFKQYYPDNYPAGSAQFTASTELLAGTAPDFPANFLADLAAGTLPQVSYLIPDIVHSEHPAAAPQDGMSLVSTIVEALIASPLWNNLAMFLTYDENGGFFDHVPPPVPPAGTTDEYVGGVPIGLGFRVPCLVVSPYSQGGFVCRDTFDHTSLLRFIETRFGVTAPNITDWRRQAVGDMTSAFNFAAPVPTPPVLLPVAGTDPTLEAACAEEEAGGSYGAAYPTPSVTGPPEQESGTRPSPSGLVATVTAALPEASLPAVPVALGMAATAWVVRRRRAAGAAAAAGSWAADDPGAVDPGAADGQPGTPGEPGL